ncbi:hypothetical protein [Pseudooctadecabacter sp.]|uniref:hypothetical protein n=1 Tax=Pseudooctadecabacter sp. TaxID=1966338 RepID=UPI0035C7DC1C
MIDLLFDVGPVALPVLLIALAYTGWGKGQRWAKILVIVLLVGLVIAAGLFALYAYALGQADWSL